MESKSKKSKTLPLKEIEVYQEAHEIGKEVCKIVSGWNYFHTNTLGKQFLRAADSISLNISEGYGRFYYKENKQFCYYARGSLFESAECLIKAKERKLVDDNLFQKLSSDLKQLQIRLNNYIASIGTQK